MFSLITATHANKVAAGYKKGRKTGCIQEGRDFMQEVSSYNKNRY